MLSEYPWWWRVRRVRGTCDGKSVAVGFVDAKEGCKGPVNGVV
jgi:hypothetical protein